MGTISGTPNDVVVRPQGGTETLPAAVSQVQLNDGFWADRVARIAEKTIPKIDRMNEESGRYDNFRIAAGQKAGNVSGLYFNDSDVYKWLECAAWSLVHFESADLESRIDEVTELLAAAQLDDGYLNTFYQGQNIEERWTRFRHHEMYCAGHLIQAAIAYHRTRGKRRLLDIAIRFADHICEVFAENRNRGVDTHPEIEMALVELYRETGERRYLDQASYFVDARGRHDLDIIDGPAFDQEYHQNRVPFRKLERMEGHVVRMLYLTCGAADVCTEDADQGLAAVLQRLWANMSNGHLYVTGGLGSRRETEGFGREYVLPNRDAYAETCAAVASIMWNWRMLLLETDRKYSDLIELTLYNGMLSGVSLDGERFFYDNPLSSDGRHRRQNWFECACCPSNIARTLASLPGYFYSTSTDTVFVHLYDNNEAALVLGNGTNVELRVETNYPWAGRVDITFASTGTYGVCLRIPEWADNAWQATVNGTDVASHDLQRGYLRIERSWASGDRITLELALPVRKLRAHPLVQENAGRLALMCGPIVYCVEAIDNDAEADSLYLDTAAPVVKRAQPGIDGAVVIETSGWAFQPHVSWDHTLYQDHTAGTTGTRGKEQCITAIPYYVWANREPCSMSVWVHHCSER
jgi:DUF1680 family protein